ncbi:hypothetical protein D3C81_1748610 [compost metagenome]
MLRSFGVSPKGCSAIMQQHDFPRAQLGEQLFGQPFCAKLLFPVAEHGGPQDDLHLTALGEVEQVDYPPRRTVIGAALSRNTVNNVTSALNLLFDGCRPHQPIRLVHVIMNTDEMTLIIHTLYNLRILLRMGPHDKEGCLSAILFKKIQQ